MPRKPSALPEYPTKADLLALLSALGACEDARAWVTATRGTPAALWAACPRADWMIWLAARVVDRRLLVLAACDCARTALPYVLAGEGRPRVAIETAEAWCRGEATIEQVRAAAAASAYAAACSSDAADAAAAYAADAAAYAADAYRAHLAATAAYAAAAAPADARTRERRRCARLVAARIPWAAVRDALRARP